MAAENHRQGAVGARGFGGRSFGLADPLRILALMRRREGCRRRRMRGERGCQFSGEFDWTRGSQHQRYLEAETRQEALTNRPDRRARAMLPTFA